MKLNHKIVQSAQFFKSTNALKVYLRYTLSNRIKESCFSCIQRCPQTCNHFVDRRSNEMGKCCVVSKTRGWGLSFLQNAVLGLTLTLTYPGCQRLFQRGFRFLSSLYGDPRLRPTAEDVLAFGQHRKFPPHARKTSGTQGNPNPKTAFFYKKRQVPTPRFTDNPYVRSS